MICPKCQTKLPEGAKFCLECGHGLKADTPAPHPHTVPKPERKHVTAFFSDLTGYTALTEKLDPEQVKEITGEVFAGVKGIISKYEGFIDRLLGDGVLVLFGVPKAHEDDAVRAVRAAKEIHEFIKELSPRYEARIGAPLSMHSGINTGLVVTAEVDLEKGTQGVAGDAVNLAARLSGLAGPGEILAGEETVRRTRGRFEFRDLGTKRVKGKAEPVSVYKLISSKAVTPVLDRQVSSVMVGRDSELNRLELQVMKVINGEGSVANIIGEAGIGKSRLMAELRQREVMRKVTLLEGRAISIGRNLSFHPLIDLLKHWAGISEEDSEAAAFDKLERTIRAIHPEEAEEILPFVATLMALKPRGKYAERVQGIEGEALEKLIFKNLRELLIKDSERTPLVIVMEDLHWADTSSLLLLQSLFRLAEKHRVFFINLFRPGYWQGEDRSMEKIGELLPDHYMELNIQPLDPKSGETLIENLLNIPGLPYTLRQQIIERSGGNPFFIEEVVRSLIDDGVIIRIGGYFEVTDKINSVVVPPTINDVLIARIDRLEEETRELVKVASVIGRNFFDRILKEVADSIEGIDDRLASLKDLQLIRDRMRMEELEYFFKHALAQEAAYESTLLKRRKALHVKVAQAIEKLFQERLHEFYALLAFHYSKADDLDKAEEWLIKAGEEAMRSSASSEALHFYKEALRLYLEKHGKAADREKVAVLEKSIAFALHYRGKYHESAEYFYQAFYHFGEEFPRYKIGHIHKILINWAAFFQMIYFPFRLWRKNPTDRDGMLCKAIFYQGMNLAEPVPRVFLLVHLPASLKWVRRFDLSKLEYGVITYCAYTCGMPWLGLFKLGEKLASFIRDRVNRENPIERLVYESIDWHDNFLAGKDWAFGDRNFGYNEELIDRNVNLGHLWWSGMMLQYYGWKKIEQGNFHDGSAIADKLELYGIQFDQPHIVVMKHLTTARLNFKRRIIPEAAREADQGIEAARLTDISQMALSLFSIKAQILVFLGRILEAAQTLDQAHQITAKTDIIPVHLGELFKSQASLDMARFIHALREGKKADQSRFGRQAAKWIRRSLKNAKKAACHLTEALMMNGQYYWLTGREQKALTYWEQSIKEGERLGARPDLSRTYFEVGKRLLEPYSKYKELNGIKAREYLDRAEKLFREMDLQWDLEQLERVRVEL